MLCFELTWDLTCLWLTLTMAQPGLTSPGITARALYYFSLGLQSLMVCWGRSQEFVLGSALTPSFRYTQDQRTRPAPASHQASVAFLKVYNGSVVKTDRGHIVQKKSMPKSRDVWLLDSPANQIRGTSIKPCRSSHGLRHRLIEGENSNSENGFHL